MEREKVEGWRKWRRMEMWKNRKEEDGEME